METEVSTPRLDREIETARLEKAKRLQELEMLPGWLESDAANYNLKVYLKALLWLFLGELVIGGALVWLQWTLLFFLFQYLCLVVLVSIIKDSRKLTERKASETDEELIQLVEESPSAFDVLKRWYAEDRIMWKRDVAALRAFLEAERRLAVAAKRRQGLRELLEDDGLDENDEELIDEYVNGRLLGSDLEQFELRLFSEPDLAEKTESHLALSRGLKEYVIRQYEEGTLEPANRSEFDGQAPGELHMERVVINSVLSDHIQNDELKGEEEGGNER